MSDRVATDRLPSLEERMDDVLAVLDAVGSERVALMSHSEGGNLSVLFAATYPERTVALATTGIIHRTGDRDANVEEGRWIAEQIPGAGFAELPGDDHIPWVGDADGVLDEIEEFLTGARRTAEPDRVLATVLFTDIVRSTERARELGDRRWHDLLDAHHALVRDVLTRYRGRELDTAGDGFFASFDGPARGVHTGARVAAQAGPSEVLVSSTVKDLVAGSGIVFDDRGEQELRDVGGWRLYAVANA